MYLPLLIRRASLLRMIWSQLGPALMPLIPFGNLSVPGIDLRPTRGSKVRRMASRKGHKKRGDVSIKLPYNLSENYVRGARNHGWFLKRFPI